MIITNLAHPAGLTLELYIELASEISCLFEGEYDFLFPEPDVNNQDCVDILQMLEADLGNSFMEITGFVYTIIDSYMSETHSMRGGRTTSHYTPPNIQYIVDDIYAFYEEMIWNEAEALATEIELGDAEYFREFDDEDGLMDMILEDMHSEYVTNIAPYVEINTRIVLDSLKLSYVLTDNVSHKRKIHTIVNSAKSGLFCDENEIQEDVDYVDWGGSDESKPI